MRSLIITLVAVCAFSWNSFAQNSERSSTPKNKKNSLKVGYGSTFHSNEMVGNFKYGQFTRFMGKRFALSAMAGYIDADNFTNESEKEYAFDAWKGDLNLYFLPINNTKSSLKIGGGGSYWLGDFKSRDSMDMDFNVVDEENYGWNVTAEFDVYIENTIVIGAMASYTQSENKENYYFFGLNAGLKF